MSLTFKRLKTSAVQILPPVDPPLKRMVDSLLQQPLGLPRIFKTKKYILARLEGKKRQLAKKAAGFLPVTTEKTILSSPMAKALLDELVKDKIPDPAVALRLKEMWDAEDTKDVYDPVTKTVVEVKKKNWDLRKYAMDKRLALGGYSNGSLPENREQNIVTQIQFTTINVEASERV